MKKKPFHDYIKSHKCGIYVGILASEGQARKQAWTKTGCNVFHHNRSQPLAFWTEQDILQYIKDNSLAIPSVYGDIVETKGKLNLTGVDRTGCMFCPIGVHLEKHPNRFQRMKITHPKIYDYCINQLGLGELLDYVGVDYK